VRVSGCYVYCSIMSQHVMVCVVCTHVCYFSSNIYNVLSQSSRLIVLLAALLLCYISPSKNVMFI